MRMMVLTLLRYSAPVRWWISWRYRREWAWQFINPDVARQLSNKKLTIADLIRRDGREPGGQPCASVWVVKWSKDTVYKSYPVPWRPDPVHKFRVLVPR